MPEPRDNTVMFRCTQGDACRLRRGAFTLVELLVVMAIIGLLIALLMPQFTRAREITRRTLCMSQVKQWKYIYDAYAEDNNEHFPGVVLRDLNELTLALPASESYLGFPFDNSTAAMIDYGFIDSFRYCPSRGNDPPRGLFGDVGTFGNNRAWIDYYTFVGRSTRRNRGDGSEGTPYDFHASSYYGWEGGYWAASLDRKQGPVPNRVVEKSLKTPLVMDRHATRTGGNRVHQHVESQPWSNHRVSKKPNFSMLESFTWTGRGWYGLAEGANVLLYDGSARWMPLDYPRNAPQTFVYGSDYQCQYVIGSELKEP